MAEMARKLYLNQLDLITIGKLLLAPSKMHIPNENLKNEKIMVSIKMMAVTVAKL